MSVTNKEFIEALRQAAVALTTHENELCTLDSQLGDGDHGAAIVDIANIIDKQGAEYLKNADIKLDAYLENVSETMLGTGLGSTSSLWGTYFSGLSEGAEGAEHVDETVLKHMLQKGLEAIVPVSKAQQGDKTMLDALIPATDVALAQSGDIFTILAHAADAAQEGAEKTKNYIARFGRAKNFKEQSLGHKDAGATSYSYFLQALAQAVKQ